MRTTPIVNNTAFPIKDDFIRWWDNLSWWAINMDGASWDEARTRRNKFQLANVKNEEQRANVVRVITTGIESEEMEGGKRPTTLSTGEVGTQVKKPSTTLTAGIKSSPGTKPTLSLNSRGPDVVQWQGIVGVRPQTGFFGQMTVDFTKKWQSQNGLPATGIVDAQSWAVALGTGESFAPSAQPEPTFTPPPTPTFKPSSGTKPVAARTETVSKPAQTLSASTMFDFTKWPVWAQAAAVATAVISGGYAFFGKGR